jgi:20S proteasome alpha/beta subunit
MTLVVGILCADGAVIAADKQASHGYMGQMTVSQSVTKINLIDDLGLFAYSGPIGLSQQLCQVIQADIKQLADRNYHSYIPLCQKKVREVLDPAWNTARLATGVIGQAAQADVLGAGLFAAKFKDGVKLAEISPQGGVEHLSDGIPFVCLGSGKANADPFLRYIRYIFFQEKRPNLNEAVLAAYWTVRAAIDAGSPGVGLGIDVFVLDNTNAKTCRARRVDEVELAEAKSLIGEAEDAWRQIRERIRGAGGAETEPPTLKGS